MTPADDASPTTDDAGAATAPPRHFHVVVNHFTRDGVWDGDLERAFSTLLQAKADARHCTVSISVIVHESDVAFFTARFASFENVAIKTLKSQERVPFIADIFSAFEPDRALSDPNRYAVYLNSDINVPYFFFDFVNMNLNIIKERSGLIINRKDIIHDDDFQHIYGNKTVDVYRHPGRDCFIFPELACKFFQLGDVRIAAPPIDHCILLNMLIHLDFVQVIDKPLITLHEGDGRLSAWNDNKHMNNNKNNEISIV